MTYHDISQGAFRPWKPGPRFGLAGGRESGYISLPSDIPFVLAPARAGVLP